METLLKIIVGVVFIAIGLFFVGWALTLVVALLFVFVLAQLLGLKISVTKNNQQIGYIKYFKYHSTEHNAKR